MSDRKGEVQIFPYFIPDDLVFLICSFLPIIEIVKLERLNKKWKQLIIQDRFWFDLVKRDGDDSITSQFHHNGDKDLILKQYQLPTWKEFYKQEGKISTSTLLS